jgi:hypothetical protein
MKSPQFPSLYSPASLCPGLAALTALVHIAAAEPTTSYNTGRLGKVADGASTTGVVVDQAGALAAFGDYSSTYALGDRTEVPFRSELNPPANSPFTIEFWAKPTAYDGDDAPIGNRLATGNRTGWVFFQRPGATGWNFRTYNGNGNTVGWDLTGGTSTLNSWSHVVVVWSGTGATLYVNGIFATETNVGAGGFVANTTESFRVGALIDGASPYVGFIDEVALYAAALDATQIAAHYAARSSTVAGAYRSLVMNDGALLHLQQNPPEVKVSMIGAVPTVTFTGILAQSPDLANWEDLTTATSPFTPVSPRPGKLYFRSHR